MNPCTIDLPPEIDALATIRGMLIAFVTWLAATIAAEPAISRDITEAAEIDVVLGTLVHRFIREHAPALEGPDAALWYSRLVVPGDPYQPHRFDIVAGDAPIVVEQLSPIVAGLVTDRR